jgi:predicted nucleotidyltransferase
MGEINHLKLREALRADSSVRFALLFGSVARREDHENSDVDLLVEMREDSLVRKIDLALTLEEQLARNVDVITLADAESNPLLLTEALREGQVLVDREDRWEELRPQLPELERRARSRIRHGKQEALAGIEALLTR